MSPINARIGFSGLNRNLTPFKVFGMHVALH